jgi:hypothetical protein
MEQGQFNNKFGRSEKTCKIFIMKILWEENLVGARGFEPPTLRSRTVRATKLRHAPLKNAKS